MDVLRRWAVFAVLLAGACVAQPTPELPPTRTLAPFTAAPAASETPAPLAASPTPQPSATVTPTLVLPTALPTAITLGDVPAMERRLYETPILSNLATERVRQIFAYGQTLGRRANVFTTIGDSNTTNGDFLQPIGMDADAYCTWGDYGTLRETVNYFSVPPSDAARNSFTHHSLSARMGFNSASVLDPFWAGGTCSSGESPLACEYRSIQPSTAVIMLGGIDVNDLTTAEYHANLRAIVQYSAQQGIIPVLTTFVVLSSRDVYAQSLEFNMMLLDIAAEEQVPLINLWAAAQTLPGEGIGPDGTHLKAEVGSFCSFDGAQARLGGTLRNLLTLQALDALRREVLAR